MKPKCPRCSGELYQIGDVINRVWYPDDIWACDKCPPGFNRYRPGRYGAMVATPESIEVRKQLYGTTYPAEVFA